MADAPFRVLPRLDARNGTFWRSGEDATLRILRCDACAWFVHPPTPVCPRCLGRALTWSAVSGRGTVHSVTVNHQQWNPTMPTPYAVALVELDEQPGLRLLTNVVDCEPTDVVIGQRVEVVFEQHGEVWIPLFRPAAAG